MVSKYLLLQLGGSLYRLSLFSYSINLKSDPGSSAVSDGGGLPLNLYLALFLEHEIVSVALFLQRKLELVCI